MLLLMFAKIRIGNGDKRDASNCLGTPDTNTVLVVDRSEGISTQTLDEIRSRALAFIVDSTVENERITVFAVNDSSKDSLVPLISLCRPPVSGSQLTQNVQSIQKQFRDKFKAPMDSALQLKPGNSPESPIAQALIDISRTRFLRGRRNTLLVFSDMLENTKAFSLYGCQTPKDVVARFRKSRLGGVERPSFVNTKVILNLIPRSTRTPTALECRDSLWVWFFGDDSGPDAGVTLDYLPGVLASVQSSGAGK
jgi:hypothetical protein